MTVDLIALVQVVIGLVLLTFAADRLVVSAARLSRLWGLSPILIGAVVVGLGTSLPEMLVSGIAAAEEDGLDLALGNIVGSNIANLTLVLGISVILSPIVGQRMVLKREGVVMLVSALLLAALAWDGGLSLLDGTILSIGLMVGLWLLVFWSRNGNGDISDEVDEMLGDGPVDTGREILLAGLSLVATLIGARLLVTGAETIALDLGISNAVVGLTLVAVGTSLPELATAIAAARRHENALVLGNVLGSNLFNALGVGGVAGIVGDGRMTTDFRGPLVVMMVVSVIAGLLASVGDRLARWEGAVLLIGFSSVLLVV